MMNATPHDITFFHRGNGRTEETHSCGVRVTQMVLSAFQDKLWIPWSALDFDEVLQAAGVREGDKFTASDICQGATGRPGIRQTRQR